MHTNLQLLFSLAFALLEIKLHQIVHRFPFSKLFKQQQQNGAVIKPVLSPFSSNPRKCSTNMSETRLYSE